MPWKFSAGLWHDADVLEMQSAAGMLLLQNCHSEERQFVSMWTFCGCPSLGSGEGKSALSLAMSGLDIPAWLPRSSSCMKLLMWLLPSSWAGQETVHFGEFAQDASGRGEGTKRVIGGQCLSFIFVPKCQYMTLQLLKDECFTEISRMCL